MNEPQIKDNPSLSTKKKKKNKIMQPKSVWQKETWACYITSQKASVASSQRKDTFQDRHLCLWFLWWYRANISHPVSLCTLSVFRWKKTLSCPKWKLTGFGHRSFSVQAPLVWNSLPPNIRHSSSLSQFKTSLKTFLFTSAFSELPWFPRRFRSPPPPL